MRRSPYPSLLPSFLGVVVVVVDDVRVHDIYYY
jgi:hypothetical protein